MTFADIEQKVRLLVNDTSNPYRFESEVIWGFIADAVSHLRTINPSERYGGDGLIDDTIPEPSAEANIRFRDRHKDAIVKYTAHKIYELDATDVNNLQLSEALRGRAEALMQL